MITQSPGGVISSLDEVRTRLIGHRPIPSVRSAEESACCSTARLCPARTSAV